MHPLLVKVEAKYRKDALADKKIGPGDTIRVFSKVKEGNKERLQVFEGIVIAIRGEGISKMMKVRKFSYGIGVERTFPVHSPNVEKIEVIKYGKPRRAKLFYLRKRVGKRALRVKENLAFTNAQRQQKKSKTGSAATSSKQEKPPVNTPANTPGSENESVSATLKTSEGEASKS